MAVSHTSGIPGIYASSVTFPSGKTITLKSASATELPEIRFGVSGNDEAIMNGGLIFDGLKIVPSGDYFISVDKVGDIAEADFKVIVFPEGKVTDEAYIPGSSNKTSPSPALVYASLKVIGSTDISVAPK